MAKDTTLHGVIIITLLQFQCTVLCGRQIKTVKDVRNSQMLHHSNRYVNGGSNNEDLYNRKSENSHDLSIRVRSVKTQQGDHFKNSLSPQKRTNSASANIEDRYQTSLLRKLGGANIKLLFMSKANKYINPVTEDRSETEDTFFDTRNEISQRRLKRSAALESASGQLQRHKRDLSEDTWVGLILGGCVLGLLTAFLLICACARCNAVRKSEDGKTTVPDLTPTLFAVAKGYDNVAFDTDDPKDESPSNEIPMEENVNTAQTYQTVSVS